MHANPRPKILGSQLLVIVEKIFQGERSGTSFEALIADAQREWASASSLKARAAIRARTVIIFWRALFIHFIDRLLTPPGRQATRLVLLAIASFLGVGGTLDLARHYHDPHYSLARSWVDGLMPLAACMAFILHPANIARRDPSAPNRGWWPYLQFLAGWFPVLSLWLLAIGEGVFLLVTAVAFAFFGWLFASLPGNEDLYSARKR